MFENRFDPELLVQFDLLIPEHQHVGMVPPRPPGPQHIKISSCSQNQMKVIFIFYQTLEEIAVLIEICKLEEGGLEISGLEQSVVMVVRHTGILDKGFYIHHNTVILILPSHSCKQI